MIKTDRYMLFKGDCLNILPKLEEKSIDLVVTSPPYDNLRTYEDSCLWDFDIFKAVADDLYRLMKDGGVIIWVVGDSVIKGSKTGTSFHQALYFKSIGFNIHDVMIWEKPYPSIYSAKVRYGNVFEYMFVLSKGKPKTFNAIKDRKNIYAGTKSHGNHRNRDGSSSKNTVSVISEYGYRYNIWRIGQASSSKERTGHPAQFPLQLANDHILSWSNEGDIILDPFMGSGTTGVACLNLNRKFIGIEKVDKYFQIVLERIKESNDKNK